MDHEIEMLKLEINVMNAKLDLILAVLGINEPKMPPPPASFDSIKKLLS